VNPNETLRQLAGQVRGFAAQASQAMDSGYHSRQAGVVGGLLASAVVPYGLKGLSRGAGRLVKSNSKANVRAQWLQTGRGVLAQCENSMRQISVNSRMLAAHGNSSKLLLKLNRARRATNPVTLLSTLVVILEEVAQYELIWNSEIPAELERRTAEAASERSARAALRASSPQVVRLSRTVDIFNRTTIAERLRHFPTVSQSIQGAMDALARQGPDGNRQTIASCRASIEALAIQLGGSGDWKEALKQVMPSETDQKVVVGAWNYLSGKGAHGGHDPTLAEAEHGLRITIATLEYIAGKAPT
jgi:hypothetical protein